MPQARLTPVSRTIRPDREVDIVFVHGLGGDAKETWQARGIDAMFWPQWLAEEYNNIAVWTLGYDAGSRGDVMAPRDRATNVLDLLKQNNAIGSKPIFFVCHSLGGLLVKRMLQKAENDYPELLEKTKAVLFLATPHRGSFIATLVYRFLPIRYLFRVNTNVRELENDNDSLLDLNRWYIEHSANADRSDGIYGFVYREDRGLFMGIKAVSKASADPGHPVVVVPVDEDHVTICKPLSKDSQVVGGVRRILEVQFRITPSSEFAVTPLSRHPNHRRKLVVNLFATATPLLLLILILALNPGIVIPPIPPQPPTPAEWKEGGRGTDGEQDIGAQSDWEIFNGATTLASSVVSNNNKIQLIKPGIVKAGDEILIHYTQDRNGSRAGQYEFNYIAAVDSDTKELVLESPLLNSYDAGGDARVQVIRVPNFKKLTISGTIKAPRWDGATGGIVAFRVQDELTLTVNGRLIADSAGFRGGSATDGAWPRTFGMQGEGHASVGYAFPASDISQTDKWSARDTGDNGGGAGHWPTYRRNGDDFGSGGGGGANQTAGDPGDDFDGNTNERGLGGRVVVSNSLKKILLGGGGGSGGPDNNANSQNNLSNSPDDSGGSSAGGAGGGIIFIAARILTAQGGSKITAIGGSGTTFADQNEGGGGGGGAGGVVYLRTINAKFINRDVVEVTGGAGGTVFRTGGGGGKGYYRIEHVSASLDASNKPILGADPADLVSFSIPAK